MDTPDILSFDSKQSVSVIDETENLQSNEDLQLQEQVVANFEKPNLPNINVTEHIVICLDICFENMNSLYRLGDGTTFTPINMMKRVLDFFLHSKHAINKKTQFALLILKDDQSLWVHDFTNNVKDIVSAIDILNAEESTSENFDFNQVFEILKQNIEVPQYKQGESMLAPPYIVRMLVLYGRSNCVPQIPLEDAYYNLLKAHPYFYIDILFAHDDDCALYKCEEIYENLQDLDDGYSYVFEAAKNATRIHANIAKLLAHPLQRPLQKNTNYSFGIRY